MAVPGVFLVNLRKLVVPQTHLRQLCCTNKDEVGTLSQEADRRGKEKRETEKTRQAWKDGKSEGRNISVDRLRRKHARTATCSKSWLKSRVTETKPTGQRRNLGFHETERQGTPITQAFARNCLTTEQRVHASFCSMQKKEAMLRQSAPIWINTCTKNPGAIHPT